MGERFRALWNDHKFDQPRLRCGRNEGYGRFRYVRLNVFHQHHQQPVCNICGQIKPLVYGLFFAILTRVANHHLARRCVERCLRRMFKRRAFLDEVIAQKPEAAALRKYSGIVIHGAIFEAEKHTAGYAITLGYLCDLTVCKELAFHST